MIRLNERLFGSDGRGVAVSVNVEVLEIRAMGEALPLYQEGAPRYVVEFASWAEFVAAIRLVLPELTEDQIRTVLQSKSSAVIDRVLR